MTDVSRMAKSPDAFRTISEVSEALDVPQHVLRFWEAKFTQIKPLKRAGGRRYYRPDDIDLLKGIRALLYGEGFTIKGVQKVLREQGAKHVTEIGRVGVKDAGLKRDGETGSASTPMLAGAMPTVEQVNLSSEQPSETLLAEQRERLENVLDELLNLREMLQRRPQFSQRKISAAE